MPDFDVGAVRLSTPPSSAPIQAYRPAVLVQNNGVHDALAVGSLRIYSPAGLLIFTTEIYSGTISPGDTELAQAVDYWTPPALGKYMFIAYVSCINDQYEPNNNLAPCFVTVTSAPPPPPPPVSLHASQHEDGGADEINIDGMHGKTADAQTALAHKTSHQAAGSDQLSIAGLSGKAADPQTPVAHHARHEAGGDDVIAGVSPGPHAAEHEDGGDDEISVQGLQGILALPQQPVVHGDEAHTTPYQPTSEKGAASGYPELDTGALVPSDQLGTGTAHQVSFLRGDQSFSSAPIRRAAFPVNLPIEVNRAETATLIAVTFPPGYFADLSATVRFRIRFMFRASVPCHANIHLDKNFSGNPGWGTMCNLELTAIMPGYPDFQYVDVDGALEVGTWSLTERKLVGHARALQHPAAASAGTPVFADAIEPQVGLTLVAEDTVQVRLQLVLPDVPDVYARVYSAVIDACGGPNP